MTSYTPGPWVNESGCVNGVDSRERFLGRPSDDIFDASEWPAELYGEACANAALIAAAPDLLDALQEFLATDERGQSAWQYAEAMDRARAAIRKATTPRWGWIEQTKEEDSMNSLHREIWLNRIPPEPLTDTGEFRPETLAEVTARIKRLTAELASAIRYQDAVWTETNHG
jgi:hypothetical protein